MENERSRACRLVVRAVASMLELNDVIERCSETSKELYRTRMWLDDILSLSKKGRISGFRLPPLPDFPSCKRQQRIGIDAEVRRREKQNRPGARAEAPAQSQKKSDSQPIANPHLVNKLLVL
jgi:hypothetical protein